MECRLEEIRCPHCGNQTLEQKENKNPKSIWKRIFEWLKCRNENMLMRFYYKSHSKKMLKKLPVFVSKQWECPDCGNKYNDPEELSAKIEKIENLAVGVMATWVVYNISVILIWYFAFQHQGLYAVTLVLLLGLLAMLFVHSGLRQTALQRKLELGKMECEIKSCERHC